MIEREVSAACMYASLLRSVMNELRAPLRNIYFDFLVMLS